MSASRTLPLLRSLLIVSRDVTSSSTLGSRLFNTINSALIKDTRNVRHKYQSACTLFNRNALHTNLRSVSSTRLTSTGVSGKPISRTQAEELVLRLTAVERENLLMALQEFESNKVKAEYEAENVPPPTLKELLHVASHNAIPFIGFGFLDNAIMIIAGDQIEISLGAFITISTMAAAALGNTISDVLGIGSAWYVEQLAAKIGMKPPNLSPIQLDMSTARAFSNLGRAAGIVIGCLLGMLPLLFMNNEPKKSETDETTASP